LFLNTYRLLAQGTFQKLVKLIDIMTLVDKEVIGLNGWIIGTVKNVFFDETTWKVGSLDVELDGDVAKEYELKKILRSTHVPLDVSVIQGIGDKVTLKTSKEELKDIYGNLGK
jgi:sporulation protein YlmC with PRC-barrel domain